MAGQTFAQEMPINKFFVLRDEESPDSVTRGLQIRTEPPEKTAAAQ